MASGAVDWVLSFGRIASSSVKGALHRIAVDVAQFTDDKGNDAGGSTEQDFYGIAGHYCRPMPPDLVGHCEVVSMRLEDDDTVIASRDLRMNKRVQPNEGDVGIVHYGGGFATLRWDVDNRGTLVAVSSPRLDSQLDQIESAHALIMDPSSGNSSIMLLHALGSGLIANKNGDILIANKGGSGASANVVCHDDGLVSVQADKGLKCTGAVMCGDVTAAREVPLHQETADMHTPTISALTKLSAQIQALGGAGCADDIAQIGVKLAALQTTGKATTLKASPV